MEATQPLEKNHRIGFHYFPDLYHYRQTDLHHWLPVLNSLGARWVTLLSHSKRAIPEFFINALLSQQVAPVIQIHNYQHNIRSWDELKTIVRAYAKWGIRYISFFDRPNARSSWSSSEWAREDLVERFLDFFIPVAKFTLDEGIVPVFPPLAPGGDYWDLVFLQNSLRGLKKRNRIEILEKIVFGAYALSEGNPLIWGWGGPKAWPNARPYFTPIGSHNHLGVCIFDWYSSVIETELGTPRPILLLRAGELFPQTFAAAAKEEVTREHIQKNLGLIKACDPTYQKAFGDNLQEDFLLPGSVNQNVIACNFWVLSAQENDPFVHQAWIKPDGVSLPIVRAVQEWIQQPDNTNSSNLLDIPLSTSKSPEQVIPSTRKILEHYLLLPVYAWGVADWDLDSVRPFILERKPTVGFSIDEAQQSSKVTIFEHKPELIKPVIQILQASGCQVDLLTTSGTVIASEKTVNNSNLTH
jgi:hypothetical protein